MQPSETHRPTCRRAAVAALLLASTPLFAPTPSFAGVELKVRTVDRSTPRTRVETSVMTVEGDNLELDMLTVVGGRESRSSMIYQGARQRAFVIDHAERAYTPIDRETIRELGASIQRTMAEVDRQIAQMPPEQRQVVQEALGAGAEAAKVPTTVVKTDETATKQGLETVKYRVERGGTVEREAWVASWDQLPESDELKAALEGMGQLLGELVKAFEGVASSALGVKVFDLGANPIEDLERMGGFPVETRNFENGRVVSETVLEGVSRKEVDPRTFVPPDAYRLRAMDQ